MTELEINKTIHEGTGKCWHELRPYGSPPLVCKKCGDFFRENDPDAFPSYTSSWVDYGQALEWAQAQDWFQRFWEYFYKKNKAVAGLLVPLEDSTALAEFITAYPEYFKGGEREGRGRGEVYKEGFDLSNTESTQGSVLFVGEVLRKALAELDGKEGE